MARDMMSDEERAFHERVILGVRATNGRKPTNHHLVLDGIFRIARTGSPSRDLPEEFGKWSSVHRQFRHSTSAGLWARKLRVAIDRKLFRFRNLVARSFNKLKNARRVATHYDETSEGFLGFIDITSIRLWIRHL